MLKNIDLSKFDTKIVNSFVGLFHGCKSLEEIDLSNLVTNNVNNIRDMFEGCENLKKIKVGKDLYGKIKKVDPSLLEKVVL